MDAPTIIRLPAGVRDFLPEAAALRRRIAERVLGVFEAWGYSRIITPAFECADVLERGLGADARAAAIRFVEPGSGEVVALRPDITPQVARLVATRYRDSIGGPIRFCYEGAVTRFDPAVGPREILQAGIELVDSPIATGDAEVVAVAMAALAASQLGEARLDLGHVAPVRHVLTEVARVDAEAATRLQGALARKDRATVERVATALAGRVPETVLTLARALVGLWGSARDVLVAATPLPWPDAVRSALEELATTIAAAHRLVGPDDRVPLTIDLGWVRGFDYYTGLRVAGYAAGAADAVLRGGRYDELVGRYGRAARAVGFAVDVEAIAEATATGPGELPASVIIIDADGARAAAVARALRRQRIPVALEPVSSAPAAGLARYLGNVGAGLALVMRPNGALAVIRRDGSEVPGPRDDYATAAAGDATPLAQWLDSARSAAAALIAATPMAATPMATTPMATTPGPG